MITALAELDHHAQKLGITLNPQQLALLENYCVALIKYNENINLVSRADPFTIVHNHILDSLSLLPVIQDFIASNSSICRLIDVGSGAGFPALILALLSDNLDVTLIESISKKANFLSYLVTNSNISQRVHVFNTRAEVLAHKPEMRGHFVIATARAIGRLDLIVELTLPFLTIGGLLLAQKSKAQAASEVTLAKPCLSLLGGQVQEVLVPELNVLDKKHVIIKILKVAATPQRFPRATNKIKRQPLT